LTPPPNVDQRLEDLIEVGRRSYPARPNVVHFGTYSARLTIGAFCSIADSVEFILDGDHRVDWVTTFPIRIAFGLPEAGTDGHPATRGDITVGNDVWIGRGATILSGVTVGDGAVIGARSVVARDVPPYGIAVGNPAQVARFRFSDDVIEALLRIRWWEWPDPVIEQRVGELCDTSVRDFVAKYNPADGSSHEVPRS
jgi:acetyltransferase-like isoleucine patch superfamily enzyme